MRHVLGSARGVWRNRRLAGALAVRALRTRYAGSSVGAFWMVIQPLVMVTIYTIVFTSLFTSRLATGRYGHAGYVLYLCAGLLPWLVFQDTILRLGGCYIENANLIKKVDFPKTVLLFAVMIEALINAGIMCALYAGLCLATGHPEALLGMPLYVVSLLFILFFAFGLGLILCCLQVFVRDSLQTAAILLQLWFWMTPIIYDKNVLPPALWRVFRLNPTYWFSSLSQSAFGFVNVMYRTYVATTSWSVAVLAIGVFIYSRVRNAMLDEL
jgi:lipopolysaccharide transport system permease protein